MADLDAELRTNLCLMNEMFDNIIRDANIPAPDVPTLDLTTSQDFAGMGEMLLGKLASIEKCCDTAAASTQKKYDARTIRDKIAVKRRQLAELEAENAALVETARRQEKALRQMNQGGDDAVEAQQNVIKLRTQLQAAQKEIKVLEERRHGLLAENRRLKGQFQAVQKAASRADAMPDPNATEDEMNLALAALETKQQELEARKKREQDNYQRKMAGLKDQKERLTQEKAALEQKLKERQKELELIHHKATSRYPAPLQLRK
jgi:chromosome segregation ATPase